MRIAYFETLAERPRPTISPGEEMVLLRLLPAFR
jgi:hypothetical protein